MAKAKVKKVQEPVEDIKPVVEVHQHSKPILKGVSESLPDACKTCGHKKTSHHGADCDWCNHPGCACLTFK